MKKKLFLAVCAVTAATAMTVGLVACNDNTNSGMSAEDAAAKIATFTSSPSTINATFKQTYKLDVDSTNASFKAFEKDIADTVTIQADFTAGNVYYYGKKVAKDNSVMEQLVVKEDSTYYYLTTTSAKTALADEGAAKTKISELMTSLSKQTTGYVDSNAFVYSAKWVNTYLLLGSGTIKGTESNYFTYEYDKTEDDGLKVDIDMKYIGYYGDAGVFEFGTDATHTGATASIVTNDKGYITSFNQTLNNHLDMNIVSPAIPLDLAGTRSLTATYNGTITKKAASDINQTLSPATAVVPTVEHATITTYDFNQNPASLQTPTTTISIGNILAIKVECDEGYEVKSVKVNNEDTEIKYGYYCYMTPAQSGQTLNIAVVVGLVGAEAPTVGTIVVPTVEHATVETYDFKLGDFSTLGTTSETVTPGNYVAVKVTCDAGYELAAVYVNGEAATNQNGYYCHMHGAVAGTTYNVIVVVVPEGTKDLEVGTIVVVGVDHATVTTYDFTTNGFQFVEGTTVAVGNYVAVKVTCETGYSVSSVTVNGVETTLQGGQYYCHMTAVEAGGIYIVVITLTANS